MSKRKNLERAKRIIYRSGEKIDRASWDKYQRELRELEEERRLKALGLSKPQPKLFVAERQGLEKVAKQIITPDELRR